MDLRFIGFKGYPGLKALFGTHYAGFKPWYFNQPQILKRYSAYEDFAFWFREYLAMAWVDYPDVRKIKRLAKLDQDIRELTGIQIGEKLEPAKPVAALKRPPKPTKHTVNPPARGRRAKGKKQGGKKPRQRGGRAGACPLCLSMGMGWMRSGSEAFF